MTVNKLPYKRSRWNSLLANPISRAATDGTALFSHGTGPLFKADDKRRASAYNVYFSDKKNKKERLLIDCPCPFRCVAVAQQGEMCAFHGRSRFDIRLMTASDVCRFSCLFHFYFFICSILVLF